MAAFHSLAVAPFLLIIISLSPTPPAAAARPANHLPSAAATLPLAARLKLDVAGAKESTANCWESLMELQACSGEIILFFLNGETYLGRGCCDAIRVIGEHCWPNLIETLGFTGEESDVLEGYCDRADEDDDGDDNNGGGDEGEGRGHHSHTPPPLPLPHPAVAQSPAAVHGPEKALIN